MARRAGLSWLSAVSGCMAAVTPRTSAAEFRQACALAPLRTSVHISVCRPGQRRARALPRHLGAEERGTELADLSRLPRRWPGGFRGAAGYHSRSDDQCRYGRAGRDHRYAPVERRRPPPTPAWRHGGWGWRWRNARLRACAGWPEYVGQQRAAQRAEHHNAGHEHLDTGHERPLVVQVTPAPVSIPTHRQLLNGITQRHIVTTCRAGRVSYDPACAAAAPA
jgi:hypothetical protein